jgi:hypothetical protein
MTKIKLDEIELAKKKRMKTAGEDQVKLDDKHELAILKIEEIKNIVLQMPNMLNKSVKEEIDSIIPEITQAITKDLDSRMTVSMEKIKLASGLAHDAILSTNNVLTSHKRELTIRRLWLSATFFMGSVMTVAGIFYFFPQNVHYNGDSEFIKTYHVGKIARDNYHNFNPETKKIFEREYKKYA